MAPPDLSICARGAEGLSRGLVSYKCAHCGPTFYCGTVLPHETLIISASLESSRKRSPASCFANVYLSVQWIRLADVRVNQKDMGFLRIG